MLQEILAVGQDLLPPFSLCTGEEQVEKYQGVIGLSFFFQTGRHLNGIYFLEREIL